VLFGVIGWVMKQLGWPRPPLILGFVLGAIFERYFYISTQVYGAAWALRPVVVVVLALAAWVIWRPLLASVRATVGTMRRLRLARPRLDASAGFTAALIVAILVALLAGRDWPP
jgi:putative tricarboxylic transport membrane protein